MWSRHCLHPGWPGPPGPLPGSHPVHVQPCLGPGTHGPPEPAQVPPQVPHPGQQSPDTAAALDSALLLRQRVAVISGPTRQLPFSDGCRSGCQFCSGETVVSSSRVLASGASVVGAEVQFSCESHPTGQRRVPVSSHSREVSHIPLAFLGTRFGVPFSLRSLWCRDWVLSMFPFKMLSDQRCGTLGLARLESNRAENNTLFLFVYGLHF